MYAVKHALFCLLAAGAFAALSAAPPPPAVTPPPRTVPPPAAAPAGVQFGQFGQGVRPHADFGKFGVEQPLKGALAGGQFGQFGGAPAAAADPAGDGFVNPKVEPGKVQWHADFAEACRASAQSGKPVLLFQMMGKLDEQFC
jgi:hypothetical protein